MKNLKKTFFNRYNALISVLLSLLGFGSCINPLIPEYPDPPIVAEYGVPYATYVVSGTVRSELTAEAIPNIQVIMGYDTTVTDNYGNYKVYNGGFPEDQTFLLQFKDVDGKANGEFEDVDLFVDFTDPNFSAGSSTWNVGETEKVIDVNLEEKE